jgi:Uma2 family endonuclease
MAIGSGLITAEELSALPTEGMRLELIRGELIAMAPTHADHGDVAGALHAELGYYIRRNRLGKVYSAETGFLIARNPDTVRAPDIAFIQTGRLTPEASAANWNPVIPDLVVEVISSGDRAAQIDAKVQMWLDAGVRLVWVVYPPRQEVMIHHAGQPVVTLTAANTLNGEDVVPGFALSVGEIFG